MQDDLVKKVATAEGSLGRVPYSILAGLYRLFGWKRFEKNTTTHHSRASDTFAAPIQTGLKASANTNTNANTRINIGTDTNTSTSAGTNTRTRMRCVFRSLVPNG